MSKPLASKDFQTARAKPLAGKVALVTGGSAGIGLETARRFAAEGAQVYLTGRRKDVVDAAVSDIDGDVVGVVGDVADLTALDALYAKITGVPTKSGPWRG